MAMLVAILSGIVTHKKILADFFLLRFGKGQRSWLDSHNASSVLFLPFILMITYTGLVSLATHYMPWGIAANYADERSEDHTSELQSLKRIQNAVFCLKKKTILILTHSSTKP